MLLNNSYITIKCYFSTPQPQEICEGQPSMVTSWAAMACLYGRILAFSHLPLITLIASSLPLFNWIRGFKWNPKFLTLACILSCEHLPFSGDIAQLVVTYPKFMSILFCHFCSYPCFHPLIVLFSFLSFLLAEGFEPATPPPFPSPFTTRPTLYLKST